MAMLLLLFESRGRLRWIISLLLMIEGVAAFSAPRLVNFSSSRCCRAALALAEGNGWIDISDVEDGGVLKKTIESAASDAGSSYESGTKVIISYRGTIADASWNPAEVVNCWLSEQQGFGDDNDLATKFQELEIDESRLIDADFFTESFVTEQLGIDKKIACKKLVMAAKRLRTTRQEYRPSTTDDEEETSFDANDRYEFTLGEGKVIRGMELGVSNMIPGEIAQILIRSDYGYGSEGYRKRNGDVMVPPFATLLFEISLK